MLIAVVSIAHVERGLKYPEPVPVLSPVAPSWLQNGNMKAKEVPREGPERLTA